jgi:hypothetical protein
MRELTKMEVGLVSGGGDSCSAEDSGNTYAGISDVGSVGDEMVAMYEGAIAFVSYVIERVAKAL